jgi:MarR family.
VSFADPDIELSDSRKRGLHLIQETGGIHQSEFWKELDVSSRTGSRIVDRLLEAELIERTETVYNERKTYYLEPKAKNLDFRLLMAGDMLSPFIGEEDIDPESDVFTQWVMNLQYNHE